MSQRDLFPAPRHAAPPAPPPAKPAPEPYRPDVEGPRRREQCIAAVLRQGPATLDQILARANRGREVLTQSVTLADLRCLAETGAVAQHIVYAAPGELTGRWVTGAALQRVEAFLRGQLGATPHVAAEARQLLALLEDR